MRMYRSGPLGSIINLNPSKIRHALLLHLLLSWVAVYQIGLGLVVSSLALSLSGWIIVVAQSFYNVKSEKCKYTWSRTGVFWWPCF